MNRKFQIWLSHGSLVTGKQRLSIVIMLIAILLFMSLGFFWLARETGMIAHQDSVNSRYRCKSLIEEIKIKVPAPVTDNPSREWVLQVNQSWRQRAITAGCKNVPKTTFIYTKNS